MKFYVETTTDTWFKTREEQAATLGNHQKQAVLKGAKFEIVKLNTNSKTNHVLIELKEPSKKTWFVYRHHVRFLDESGNIIERIPVLEAPVTEKEIEDDAKNPDFGKTDLGKKIIIKPTNQVVYENQLILPNGHFTWKEVLNVPTRIPQTKEHLNNLINLIKKVEPWREKIGKPFVVTSCYRPEPWNSRAGGAKYSKHLKGAAIDFYIPGLTKHDLWKIFNPSWQGGVGIYNYDAYIIHLDTDGFRRWR